MWGKKAFILAAIALTLTSAANADKVLLDCPNNISGLPIPDINRANLEFLSFPSKDIRSSERTFTTLGSGGGGGIIMGMDGVIDINSDITSNTMWTADNTYHVVADVNVQALLVIEPGTIVQFASSGSMSVNNGGTLISVGKPNNPVVYTSDSATPGYNDYYCPIYIEETTSASTKVTYSYIEYAYAGIVVLNKRLDTSIENNYLYNNVYGIVEQGIEHTDICNNLIFASYYSGIEAFLESTTGQADANSYILIENNTCDYYQDCGITVHGVPDSNDAGWVVLANNIVSESYQYGLNLIDGYMYASVLNTGYYDNASNKNWEFEEDDPVIETAFPYKTGTGYLPVCYLDQDCNFIDAGYQYVEETRVVGKTTDVNELPDSNYIDVGFHYPNWNFSNAGDGNTLETDFNRDLIVNFEDFAVLADAWQTTHDMNDLATLAGEWLNIVSAHPNISVYLTADPNNVTGYLNIGVTGYSYNTIQVFVFIDGEFVEEIVDFDDVGYVGLDSRIFRNGQHTIKVVAVDANNLITLSENATVNFANELYCISGDDDFEEGQDYHLSAMYLSGYNLRVKVVDWNDTVVWTSPIISGHINLTIAESVFSGQVYDLAIEEDSASWKSIWERSIGKKYKPSLSYKFAIFLPSCWTLFPLPANSANCRKQTVAKIVEVCENRMAYVILYKKQCNWKNFASVLSSPNISYVYMVSHGGSHVGRATNLVQRTHFRLTDSSVLSYYNDKLPEKNKKKKNIHYMRSLGLGSTNQMRIVHVDACSQAKYTDMASEWIDASQEPILDQLFVSWNGIIGLKDDDWDIWSRDIWYRLGDEDNYWDAQDYAVKHNDKGYFILSKVQYYGFDQITFTSQGN